MAKQAYVYSGTEWVPLASEVTNLTAYQTRALAQASNRNLIINGAMQVAQRNTSVASISSTGGTYNTADRQQMYIDTAGTWTQSVENDAPSGSGFRKSLKMLCTTANASLSAGSQLQVRQQIEGQNLQGVKKGTAAAEQLTLSFWVKSNVTGTYIVNLYDNDNTRQVAKSYTINASGTWEREVITFPADTTGVFDNDNAGSLFVRFYLAAGTSLSSGTLQTTWASNTDANTAVGQVNLASATSNYWQITGVQLEVGDTATPFEFKPFAQDLAECQRYCFAHTAGTNYTHRAIDASFLYQGAFYFPTTMRAAPTLRSGASFTVNTGNAGTVGLDGASTQTANFKNNSGNWTTNAAITMTFVLESEL